MTLRKPVKVSQLFEDYEAIAMFPMGFQLGLLGRLAVTDVAFSAP